MAGLPRFIVTKSLPSLRLLRAAPKQDGPLGSAGVTGARIQAGTGDSRSDTRQGGAFIPDCHARLQAGR